MRNDAAYYVWNDQVCSERRAFICEKKGNPLYDWLLCLSNV